ncbi:M14 family metallopeptidase [Burkholderiaceae bacterium DAT-1]|nr:M14 family metallopeptidase [Burkholderiaceae bacterium DAT-1]
MRRALIHFAPFALITSLFAADLSTHAERSGFVQTGRYQEVIDLCSAFPTHYSGKVKCIEFGKTPEGRPMKALVASARGVLTPEAAKQQGIPVVLLQGGIHAGEIDGKDAGFYALREMLDGTAARGALDKAVVVFVPVFNIDGHERFGRWNRPNQVGPEEMGWRTTAQNFNLNRDYLKADAPEMQAMLKLLNEWDPLVYVDMHVTDGAKFQHDVSIQLEPSHMGDALMRASGTTLRDNVIGQLNTQGSMALPFYMSFQDEDNPASGFADGVPPPRFSTGYIPLRNRFAILVETHSWKDYRTRVRITRNTILSVMSQVAEHGDAWLTQAHAADEHSASLGGQMMPLTYKTTEQSRMIDFKGYAYTRTPSDISGQIMVRYDDRKPQIWHVPLRDTIVPDVSVRVPEGGYLVPPAYAARVAARLKAHGVQFHVVNRPLELMGEVWRASTVKFTPESFEGHQRISTTGRWIAEPRTLAMGSLFVPIRQPLARVAIHLLEPDAPDSLLQWGEFNTAFERKEYMESYVAEDVAREMLASNPAIKTEFEKMLATDAAFAKDPAARLNFFARRHPSWDDRFNVYPVIRVDSSTLTSPAKS